MENILAGVRAFPANYVAPSKIFYDKLSGGQSPVGMFITCCDSRIVIEKLTGTGPGELFIFRNVGNIVSALASPQSGSKPGATEKAGSTVPDANLAPSISEWGAIEYALNSLTTIKDIILCGHYHCGAMDAVTANGDLSATPHLKSCLAHAALVRDALKRNYTAGLTDGNRQATAAAENVLLGLGNMWTHPTVRERVDAGDLRLHGWLLDIVTGTVYDFVPEKAQFRPLNAKTKDFPDRNAQASVPILRGKKKIAQAKVKPPGSKL